MKKMRGSVLILAALAILCLVLAAGAEAKAIVIYGNTATYVFDGQMHEVTGFSASSSGGFTYIGNAAARGTEVGTYAMGLKADDFLVDPGETIDVIDGWMMITRRPITVNITGHSAVVDYDGQEHTVSGYDVEIDDELYTENDFSFHGDASVSGTAVNSYSMWLDESDFENENNNFDVTFVVTDGRLTIQENQIEIIDEGTCGDNLTWTLDSEGLLTISGTGEMANYIEGPNIIRPWDYSLITSVVVEEGVTSIGNSAFNGCRKLNSIIISNSVDRIGKYAFASCISLTSITIPENIVSIGENAFARCSGLSSIVLNGVTNIGDSAFFLCTSLSDITLPDGLTDIGQSAFEECSGLISISIPGSVISINNCAFYNCSSLANVTIADGVSTIGDGAFYNCGSLSRITIPDSVNHIGSGAFFGCARLADADGFVIVNDILFGYYGNNSNLIIPDGVISTSEYAFAGNYSLADIVLPVGITDIGKWSFNECFNLKSILIPYGVYHIAEGAFSSCNSLTDVYYTGTKDQWDTISIGEYNNPISSARIHYNITLFDNILSLPTGLTTIESEAFVNLPNVEAIRIPAQVTSIASDAFDNRIVLLIPAGSSWGQWAEDNGYLWQEE